MNLTPILDAFKGIPPEIGTLLLAMLPVTEFQVALPFAITVYKLSVPAALFWAYVGNIFIIPIVFLLFPPIFRLTERYWTWLHRFLETHIRSLEKKHQDTYAAYGSLFLFLFVAIPTPLSGVWTASLLAVLFGIKPRYAVPTILIGQVVAILIVLFLTQSGIAMLS
jgi:uncharacterized membrane protein